MRSISNYWIAPCKRLDQLPRGGERAIGAGYAMAIAAAVVTVLYYLFAWLSAVVLFASVSAAGGDTPLVALLFGAGAGVLSSTVTTITLVGPAAFVSGVAVWRVLPARFTGAIGGILATMLTYVLGGITAGIVLFAYGIATGWREHLLFSLGEFVFTHALMMVFAFGITSWIALPAGATAGHLYERTRSDVSASVL